MRTFLGGGAVPLLCPHGMERVFDGFDVTDVLAACAASADSCPLFVEAYGYDQVPGLGTNLQLSF